MANIIQQLTAQQVLSTPAIINAMRAVKRADFVPALIREQADEDRALPTFADQTISQPYTVAFMLELLQPQSGQKILDVGSGSGWVAGILAHIAGVGGKVYGIERITELVKFAKDNLKKYHFKNLKITHGNGYSGLPKQAPFDRIHVAAAAPEVPPALKRQLAIGGRMVIPTERQDIRLVTRISDKKFTQKVYPGFVFVPLVESQPD